MYEYEVSLVRIIDGDTIEVEVDLGFRITHRMHVRLYGFNTPERGQPGYREAADHLRTLIPATGKFAVRSIKPEDKYGRWIVEVSGVADSMVASGNAVPYFGGTR